MKLNGSAIKSTVSLYVLAAAMQPGRSAVLLNRSNRIPDLHGKLLLAGRRHQTLQPQISHDVSVMLVRVGDVDIQ